MKIFPKDKIREWDAYTIQQHYRSSEELMESVAAAVVFELDVTVMAVGYAVFCGTGMPSSAEQETMEAMGYVLHGFLQRRSMKLKYSSLAKQKKVAMIFS